MTKRILKITNLKTIDSTNTYLRALAESGEGEGRVVIADEQTAGRGRRGKTFFSPSAVGLYMSILIRPACSVEDSLFITPMTATAAARAIERISGKKCGIKWVNDIYIDGKKVSGILCEASFDHKENKVNYVVVGIGINLDVPKGGFPKELEDIATSLGDAGLRDRLAASVVEEFFSLYDTMPSRDFISEYKDRSVLIGKRVEILGSEPFVAEVLDIDGECRLIVKDDNGEVKVLSSGEISTKIAR